MAYRPYVLLNGIAINFDRVMFFEKSGECDILLCFDNFKKRYFEFKDEEQRDNIFNSLFYCLNKRDVENALKKIAEAIGE